MIDDSRQLSFSFLHCVRRMALSNDVTFNTSRLI
jgi:hypothetical protein